MISCPKTSLKEFTFTETTNGAQNYMDLLIFQN
jgi:hypothetical protein